MNQGIIKAIEGHKSSGILLVTIEQGNGNIKQLAAEGGMLARAIGEIYGPDYIDQEIVYTENNGLLESFEPAGDYDEPDPPGGYGYDKETGTGSQENIDGWE